MTHLIDKDALIAEIERIRRIEVIDNDVVYNGALDEIRYYIDTLEVKEVDLEKEVINWWNAHYSGKDYTFEGYAGHYLENSTVIEIAKHFFELGLAQKGE